MIDVLKKYKNILLVTGILIIAFIGYSLFSDGSDGVSVLVSSPTSGSQTRGNNELLLLLVSLESISLDDSLFNDPAFKSLIDFGQALIPEPVGRLNPFAPVGSESDL
ncbi:hypothetical protein HYW58_02280 [Candidatus Kaiserbacteria bacterium]|nr:hypothetical protein [Candidatus Kaiserbacteria bacterium]